MRADNGPLGASGGAPPRRSGGRLEGPRAILVGDFYYKCESQQNVLRGKFAFMMKTLFRERVKMGVMRGSTSQTPDLDEKRCRVKRADCNTYNHKHDNLMI